MGPLTKKPPDVRGLPERQRALNEWRCRGEELLIASFFDWSVEPRRLQQWIDHAPGLNLALSMALSTYRHDDHQTQNNPVVDQWHSLCRTPDR